MVKKSANRKPRAVGYIRVSTDRQAIEGLSLDAQRARIEAYCQLHGYELVEIVIDAGESGKSLDRPGVQKVLLMVSTRKVDAVVIYKLDRLFRNTQDALNTSQDFDKRGVALCSISQQLDTSTPMGKFFFTITAAYAEMERCMIAERTREGLRHTRLQGKQVGCKTPYGYDLIDGRLVPNASEQAVILMVNEQHAAGMGTRKIARLLMEQGITTKEGKANWQALQVQRLLNRAEQYPAI